MDQIDCTSREQPTADDFLSDPSMFGFVCVDVTPPVNRYIAVSQILRFTDDGSSKCENNLVPEDHKKLYIGTNTLKAMLTRGYTLDHVYRFDKYRIGPAPWIDAGIEFYIDKVRTSGDAPSSSIQGKYVKRCLEEHPLSNVSNERDAYVFLNNKIAPTLGDKLLNSMETQEWGPQPAQKSVYKRLINSCWGFFTAKNR